MPLLIIITIASILTAATWLAFPAPPQPSLIILSSPPASSQRPASPATAPPPSLMSTAPPEAETAAVDILFINMPDSIIAGEQFTVTWQVTGPVNTPGTNAKLEITSNSQQSNGNGRASTNLSSTQSFGSFTAPATFTSKHSYDTPGKDIAVTASATVNGKTITKQQMIKLKK